MAAHQAPPSLGFSRQEHWSGLPSPSPMHENKKWKWSRSAVSDSLQPHGLQPTRLLCPWDSPGKSTGEGCHFLLHRSFPTQSRTYISCTGGWILSHWRSPVIKVRNTLFKSSPVPLLPPFLRHLQINDHTYNCYKNCCEIVILTVIVSETKT